jgi:hypothetical protein
MSDRPTPETDALITLRSGFGVTDYEWRQHSRKLERQRDEVQEELAQTRQAISTFLKQWDWMDGPEGWTEACLRLHDLTKAKEVLP